MKRVLQTDGTDNVAVALDEISAGESLIVVSDVAELNVGEPLQALESIPFAHKIALSDLVEGTQVLKFGMPIGRMIADARLGSLVHVHNLQTERGMA